MAKRRAGSRPVRPSARENDRPQPGRRRSATGPVRRPAAIEAAERAPRPGHLRGRRSLRAGSGRHSGTRLCARLVRASGGHRPLPRRTGPPRPGAPVPQRVRSPHGPACRVTLDTRRARLCRDFGCECRQSRCGTRPSANGKHRVANTRPCAVYMLASVLALLWQDRRGDSAASPRDRAESRQPHHGAPRPRSGAASPVRQGSSSARWRPRRPRRTAVKPPAAPDRPLPPVDGKLLPTDG